MNSTEEVATLSTQFCYLSSVPSTLEYLRSVTHIPNSDDYYQTIRFGKISEVLRFTLIPQDLAKGGLSVLGFQQTIY